MTGRRRSRRIGGAALGAFMALILPWAAEAQDAGSLALLPLENVSGSVESVRMIMPVFEEALRARGYRLTEPEKLETFLARSRIRNTGQMSVAHLASARRELGVALAMVGSIAIFNESGGNPQWGVSARMLDTDSGAIVWAAGAGFTGDDFTIALGLGTITSAPRLAEETVKRLFRDLPRAGEPVAIPPWQRSLLSRMLTIKSSYRSSTLDANPPKRVAVLPFENLSERKGAGRIVGDIFTVALVRTGRFQVVEPGTVTDALVALGATPYGNITLDTVTGLRERLGIDAIILGTVLEYSEGLKREAASSPEVAFDARMIDAESRSIVWFAERVRNGDDTRIAMHFGTIRAMVPLVFNAANEILGTLQ